MTLTFLSLHYLIPHFLFLQLPCNTTQDLEDLKIYIKIQDVNNMFQNIYNAIMCNNEMKLCSPEVY